jgi:hypothetical protein
MITSFPWPLARQSNDSPKAPARKRSLSVLLRYYDTPGVSPPSARVDPSLKQQQTQPIRFWDVWKYGAFLATKGTQMYHKTSFKPFTCNPNSHSYYCGRPFTSHLGASKKVVGYPDDYNIQLYA